MAVLSKTDHIVIDQRIHNPCATLEAIGKEADVCRERVRQILNKYNMPTKAIFIPKHGLWQCVNCGKSFAGKNESQNKLYCSRRCRGIHNRLVLECPICSKQFLRRKTVLMRQMKDRKYVTKSVFCSRHCFGLWLAANHGFRAHPENAMSYGQSKYQHMVPEINKRWQGGQSLYSILCDLQIPTSNHTRIKARCIDAQNKVVI